VRLGEVLNRSFAFGRGRARAASVPPVFGSRGDPAGTVVVPARAAGRGRGCEELALPGKDVRVTVAAITRSVHVFGGRRRRAAGSRRRRAPAVAIGVAIVGGAKAFGSHARAVLPGLAVRAHLRTVVAVAAR